MYIHVFKKIRTFLIDSFIENQARTNCGLLLTPDIRSSLVLVLMVEIWKLSCHFIQVSFQLVIRSTVSLGVLRETKSNKAGVVLFSVFRTSWLGYSVFFIFYLLTLFIDQTKVVYHFFETGLVPTSGCHMGKLTSYGRIGTDGLRVHTPRPYPFDHHRPG